MDLAAPLFALAAGMLFSAAVHLQRMGLAAMNELTGTFVSIASSAVLFWLVAPFVIDWAWFATPAAAVFAAMGLFFPALGQRLQIASVKRVGPALTSAIGSFTPFFAVLLAVSFLGETVNLQGGLGIALLISGLLLAALGPKALRGGWAAGALLLPLGAALVRGIQQPVAKVGLEMVPSPFFATLVMASVSTLVMGAWRATAKRAPAQPQSRRGAAMFIASGLLNGTGILSLNTAIVTGDLTLVAPIASTTPLWTLLLGAFIFRTERLYPRHLFVAILVVMGAALLVTR